MDVTNEESVRAAFAQACLSFGGVDTVVNNAGLASSASITETSLAEWNKNWNVLATGYFLVAREGFRLLQEQGCGGNLVFVASKNALVAGKNAAAYSTAKAAKRTWHAAWQRRVGSSGFASIRSIPTRCWLARASGIAPGEMLAQLPMGWCPTNWGSLHYRG
jgi:NAD(P)-dependent dehydrogenase (short-subunit alcohol dehydrogenase family)